jgi:hypothetical protein
MNPAVILALLSDLYAQVQELARENAELRAQLGGPDKTDPG